jgi:hypothetical protein
MGGEEAQHHDERFGHHDFLALDGEKDFVVLAPF